MQPDAICHGWVGHTRHTPVKHTFRYASHMLWLNLDTLEQAFQISPLWSLDRFNLLSFHQTDYLGGHDSVAAMVRQRISEAGGNADGPVYILTHPRHFAYAFNPVSFYFCYDRAGGKPQYFIADVNNTPWNERFSYVLPVEPVASRDGFKIQMHCDKAFHVSPFMPMDLKYHWRIQLNPEQISIRIALTRAEQACFDASLHLKFLPLTSENATALALKYPLNCIQDVSAIYWQAFKLWCKRVPFHSHPQTTIRQAKP